MARRDVLRPGQHAEAAISRAAEEVGVVQAGKGAACGGGGPRTVNKAGGDGGEAGGNGGGRVAKELSKVQQPGDTVRSAGKAPAEEGEAKAGDAGEGSFHPGQGGQPRQQRGHRQAARRWRRGCPWRWQCQPGACRGGQQGKGGPRQRQGDRSEGEKAGLGRVEVLASGGSKGIHSGEEGGELGGGLEQHLGIISIDAGGGSAGGTEQEVKRCQYRGSAGRRGGPGRQPGRGAGQGGSPGAHRRRRGRGTR